MLSFTLLAAAASTMTPISTSTATTRFKQLCWTNFPDSAAFAKRVADPAEGLKPVQQSPSEAQQPGDAWEGDGIRVGYVDAAFMPRDLPNPQCQVTASLADRPSHANVVASLTAALDLPAGKTSGSGVEQQTRWDLPGRSPDKVRLFATTQTLAEGVELRLHLLNLRGKAK